MLFVDFSSAFNTIIPQQLTHKLDQLGLSTSLCVWLLDFLIGTPQAAGPLLDQEHHISDQGGSAGSLLPPQAEESWCPGSHHVHPFYRGPIGNVLTSCITVWFGAWTTSCRRT